VRRSQDRGIFLFARRRICRIWLLRGGSREVCCLGINRRVSCGVKCSGGWEGWTNRSLRLRRQGRWDGICENLEERRDWEIKGGSLLNGYIVGGQEISVLEEI
jgi:hypothetical protein